MNTIRGKSSSLLARCHETVRLLHDAFYQYVRKVIRQQGLKQLLTSLDLPWCPISLDSDYASYADFCSFKRLTICPELCGGLAILRVLSPLKGKG
jgi:hypothetical protein